MIGVSKRVVMLLLAGSVVVMAGPEALAQETSSSLKPVKFTAEAKAQATFQNDMDLGAESTGETDSQSLELKTRLEGELNPNLSFLIEGRGVKNYGQGGAIDPETNEPEGREDFLELRQYWFQLGEFSGLEPYSLRVGRQRIREDYGFWWNRDQDAVRVLFEQSGVKGFVGVGENLAEYRTSGDVFQEDDQNLLRFMGEASYDWREGHAIEGRFLYQQDHSGLEAVGSRLKANDFDTDDADLLWLGVRVKGAIEALNKTGAENSPRYRLDVAVVTGQEDNITTSTGPNGFRTVTGHGDEDVFGWAVDAGVDVPVKLGGFEPVFHAGYAYGSGDDDGNDGDDKAFRQTGLDGNSSRLSGFSAPINNYGSVLRPDLSNLHIATVGVTLPVMGAMDVVGFYRYYRLAEKEGGITGAVTVSRTGNDADLGQGFDIVLNTDLDKQFALEQDILSRVNLRTSLGAFRAGDAYGTREGETALRGQLDLNLRF